MLSCRGVCLCVCTHVVEALCATYNFYFITFILYFYWDLTKLLSSMYCLSDSLVASKPSICPMSIPLVERSIFFGVCV